MAIEGDLNEIFSGGIFCVLKLLDYKSTGLTLAFTIYFQHLSPMSQYILQNTVAQKCLQHFIPESTESLHSFSSDFVCISS